MISPNLFFNNLKKENIDFYTGVPDSLLKSFCAFVSDNTDEKNHIISANEGGAISLAVGYHLATNKIPLVYMQNSGLGNAINPILSIADKEVYSIPMLLMVGWRGEPNVKDEPQHIKQGKVTIDLLNSMEIPSFILSSEMSDNQAYVIIKKVIDYIKKNNSPCALVVRKGSFKNYFLKKKSTDKFLLNREQSIKIMVDELDKDDIVVATTGVTSRELFEYREELGDGHERDFLTVGGMGHASQIALGIAMSKPNKRVFCFDGDGAMLMHLGSLAIIASKGCKNFKHIILNNGAHDSVGGQPTVAQKINISLLAKSLGYYETYSASNEYEIRESINKLKKLNGVGLLEIKINKGFRADLGRPSLSPIDNKNHFINFLK